MSQPGRERPPEPLEKNVRPKALARIHWTERLLANQESIVNHRPSRTHRALIFLEVKSPFCRNDVFIVARGLPKGYQPVMHMVFHAGAGQQQAASVDRAVPPAL
jgi:hypothetical protein